jgi:hypothetical protein
MNTANMAVALGENHWSQQHQANAVIHPVTRKEMEYMALMKDPRLQPLWKRGFGNECGRLFQGIMDIHDTDTCFFIKLTNIPKDRKITYSKISRGDSPKYNLNALAVDGWVYIEIRKGMYGLKQVGLLANQLLQTSLAPFAY